MFKKSLNLLKMIRAFTNRFQNTTVTLQNCSNRRCTLVSLIGLGGLHHQVIRNEKEDTKKDLPLMTDFHELIFKINKDGETHVIKVMNLLTKTVIETSERYRSLIRHFDSIKADKACTSKQVKELMIEIRQLHRDLKKYREMVYNIGNLVYNQAVSSYLAGSDAAEEIVCSHYCNLEKLAELQFQQNNDLEKELKLSDLLRHPLTSSLL